MKRNRMTPWAVIIALLIALIPAAALADSSQTDGDDSIDIYYSADNDDFYTEECEL